MLLISFFVFLFGVVVGSFLNAAIWRLGTGESVLRGRSYCPHCRHRLVWQDLIPLLSFFLLRARCRYCHQKISWQYPIVEISTALIFLLIFNFEFSSFDFTLNALSGVEWAILNQFFKLFYIFIIASFLIVLFVYDLKRYILPDKVLLPAIGLAFCYHIVVFFIQNWNLIRNLKLEIRNFEALANPLIAGLLASGFFLAIFVVSRGHWMGFGDVKLAFFMGLSLGWPSILVALFAAFFIGAIIGIGLIAFGKKQLKSEVPFGPFLITGAFIALFWGKELVDWYSRLILV